MKTEVLQQVIVVSHDDFRLVNLQILLQAGPYHVLLAKTVQKAELLVRDLEAPCILLLENDLPEGAGVSFLPKLIALSKHGITAILRLTA